MKFLLIPGLLFFWPVSLPAQVLSRSDFPRVNLKDLHPKKILEDSRDYIWLGTEQGLYRFDGFEVERFPFEHFQEDREVTAIFEDRNQVIWVGYRSGNIGFLDIDKVSMLDLEEGHPTVPITGIALNENGQLWFSTYGEGLYVFDQLRLYNFDMADGLSSNDIYALQSDMEGRIWACTDQGLNICQWENGQKRIRSLSTEDGIPDEILQTAVMDHSLSKLWFGTHDNGIVGVDPKTMGIVVPVEEWIYGPVKAICTTDHALVIGTEGNGILTLDLENHRLSKVKVKDNALATARIWDAISDREGNIWVLNDQTGISLLYNHIYSYPIQDLDIQAMLFDSTYGIWLGTSSGLYLYALETQKIISFGSSDQNIISLYQDNQRNLWLGTFGDGIYIFHPRHGFMKHFHEGNVLTNNSVLSISGWENKVWIATLGGAGEIIMDYHDGLISPVINRMRLIPGMGTDFIYRTYIDSRNRVWFGSDGQGLYVMEKDSINSIEGSKQSAFRVVYDLVEDDQDRIWFITGSNSLGLLTNDSVKQIPLPSKDLDLVRIAIDNERNIVLVHSEGILIIHPEDYYIRSVDSEYGLEQVNTGLSSLTTDPEGNLWIANTSSLLCYRPYPSESATYPRARIKYIQVISDIVDVSNDLIFKPRENVLTFHYTGLWYTNPEKISFRYQMTGYDPDWKVSSDRTATYVKLPPGDYTFRVQTSFANQFNHASTASLQFRILPPFYEKMWFIVLVSIAILLGIYSFIKNKENQIKRKMALEKEIISYQYESLNNQVNPHFLFNSFNTLLSIIEEKPALASEYLEKLSDFYRGILVYREKEIISLKEELSLVNHYIYLLKKRHGKNLSIDIRIEDLNGFVAPLTLQMLIENAIKHNIISKKYPLHIELMKQDDYLVIKNNLQKKSVPDSSTKFGLRNVKARYAILTKAPVDIIETSTSFTVKIPVIKSIDP